RVDPARLRRELVHVRHAVAPEAAVRAAEAVFGRRRLSVSETFEGMVAVDGMLDPEGGAMLLTALAPLTVPAGTDDARTMVQRRADARVELSRRQLDTASLPELGGERPHLTVLVDLNTLEHRPTEQRPTSAAPAGAPRAGPAAAPPDASA